MTVQAIWLWIIAGLGAWWLSVALIIRLLLP